MSRTVLDELLKTNFEHYQVLWSERKLHSHTAHHLGSLALLGASDAQLKEIYETTMLHYADEYKPSPHEITEDNWRNSFGDKRFCLAYRNFFNQQLPIEGDWKKKFFQILLDDTKGAALIDASLSGLFHSIIHIEYAIELNSRPVACEALTMTAIYTDSSYETTSKLQPPTNGKKSALEIMKDIRLDDHVPTFDKPLQIDSILMREALLLFHYNEWQMPDDLNQTIEELFDMSVYIYGATHKPDQIDFDFALMHLLTGMNALRKLRPHLDDKIMKKLLCGYFYLSLAVYISQKTPKINEQLISNYQLEEEKSNWKYVVDKTLHTKLATEVHLVKVSRALKDAESDYGSKGGLYLKTAVKTVDNLNLQSTWDYYKSVEPWIGVNNTGRELNVKH